MEEADDETDLGEALFYSLITTFDKVCCSVLYSFVLLNKFISVRLYDITIFDKFIHTSMILKYHLPIILLARV